MSARSLRLASLIVPLALGAGACPSPDDPEPGEDPSSTGESSGGPTTSEGTTGAVDESGSEGEVGSTTTEGPEPEQFAEFDAVIEQFIADEGLRGATAAIVHRDQGVLHVQGYGEFEASRVSLIASASKIISVGVLMGLADDGLLDVDTPISEYLSDWGEFKTDISVAQLVSNSSGMIGLDDALNPAYLCQFFDTDTLLSCGEVLYSADDAASSVPPDTEFRYGGAQWQLAGAVAEVVSGQSWAELVEARYGPCGLTTTGYRNHFLQASEKDGAMEDLQYPSFVDGDISVINETDNPSIEGGAFSSAEDYAQILLMHLRGGECEGGRVLSEASTLRMQEDRILEAYDGVTTFPEFLGYGLGWWVDRERPLISDFGAFGTNPWLDLDRGYGAVVFVEGQSWMGAALYIELEPILAAHFDQG